MLATALCLILGDSIAVKIAALRPQCESFAQNGLNSEAIVGVAPPDHGYKRVIVSMGTNDRPKSGLANNLRLIREKYPHAEFTWLAPIRPVNGNVVTGFARSHHDKYIELSTYPARDQVHPASYDAIDKAID